MATSTQFSASLPARRAGQSPQSVNSGVCSPPVLSTAQYTWPAYLRQPRNYAIHWPGQLTCPCRLQMISVCCVLTILSPSLSPHAPYPASEVFSVQAECAPVPMLSLNPEPGVIALTALRLRSPERMVRASQISLVIILDTGGISRGNVM